MAVRVSTGGFKKKSAIETTELLNKFNIWDVELSAGIYEKNHKQKLLELIGMGNNFAIHNYYPRPLDDFVLNLGSQKEDVLIRSRAHCREAIKLASDLNISNYSVHAGFCIDPKPSSLGENISGYVVNSFNKVKNTFLKEIYELSTFASNHNVKLMVENNVTSRNTFELFKLFELFKKTK